MTQVSARIGAEFPQIELAGDPGALRAWAQAAEQAGYRHLSLYDHVLGADPVVHTGWDGSYDVHTPFHEPLVALGYLAGLTSLELATGILVLPQRQTALVAKQAAEIDLLSGGQLRLGVGIGWNRVEYEALGKSFTDRGRRSEEQIALLRQLWTEPSIGFEGHYEQVVGAGIAPLPVQRPIPIWLGGASEPAYRRIGRLADGWLPMVPPGSELEAAREVVEAAAREAGRDPATLGMEGRAAYTGDLDSLLTQVERWIALGATHVVVTTTRSGLVGVDEHIAVLAEVAEALGLAAIGSR